MKLIVLTAILTFGLKYSVAQYSDLVVRTNLKNYKTLKGRSLPIKLQILNKVEKKIEILDVFGILKDSILTLRASSEIYLKINGAYKKYQCKVDDYPLGGFQSKVFNKKIIIVSTLINPDCIVKSGNYKIRLFISYKVNGEDVVENISSNWFYLKIK